MSLGLDLEEVPPADAPLEPAPAAWRRPGLTLLLFAHRALGGLLISLPVAATLGATTAQYPRGASELFDPGGLVLLEALRLSRRALPAIAWSGGALTLALAALGLLPLGMLIAGLGRRGPLTAALLFTRAWSAAGPLALLFGFTLAAQVVTAALLALLGGKLLDALRLVPPTEDLAFLALFALIFLVLAAIGVIRDLAYAAAVHEGRGFYTAVVRALRAAASRPLRVFFAWASRALLGALGFAAAAWLAPGARDAATPAILLAFVLHQAALAGLAFARASWLAAALRALAVPQ